MAYTANGQSIAESATAGVCWHTSAMAAILASMPVPNQNTLRIPWDLVGFSGIYLDLVGFRGILGEIQWDFSWCFTVIDRD